jgi:hypothetical protein
MALLWDRRLKQNLEDDVDLRSKFELGGLALLVVAGCVIYASFVASDRKIQIHAQEAAVAEEKAKGYLRAAAMLEEAVAKLETKNKALEAKYAAVHIPPKPSAPPAMPVIVQQLLNAGLAPGLTVSEAYQVSQLSKPDGERIWTWEEESKRVPPLEEKVRVGEEVQAGLRAESTQKDQILATTKAAIAAQSQETNALKDEVKAMVHKENVGKFKTGLKIFLAAVIGYEAGQHLHR